jgi:hypothetical protein
MEKCGKPLKNQKKVGKWQKWVDKHRMDDITVDDEKQSSIGAKSTNAEATKMP